MANLPGWPFWKDISITGQSGAGTDYQVKFEIGDSAGGNFHLEGHCDVFPQDIRITDNDGTTLLDHFVEDLTADPIVVHVEVKDDLGSNRDIRVYYGKSGESTASNIETTFLLGDDFPGSSIDTGKWDGKTSNAVVSGGIMSYGGDYTFDNMKSITQFGPDAQVRTKIKILTPTSYANKFGFIDSSNTHSAHFYIPYNDPYRMYSWDGTTSSYVNTNIAANTWMILDVKILGETNTRWFYNDVEGSNSPKTTNPSNSSNLEVIFSARSNSAGVQSEWVAVSKYQATEPAFSSAGVEQTPGVLTGVFYGPLVGPFGGPI